MARLAGGICRAGGPATRPAGALDTREIEKTLLVTLASEAGFAFYDQGNIDAAERRPDVDFVGQAVRVAMDCGGRPVQLIWSREEDMTHDFYRPMHVASLRATLDTQGQV